MISNNLPISSLISSPNQLYGEWIIQSYFTDEEIEVQRGETRSHRDFWNICISWQPLWSSFYFVLVSLFRESKYSFIHSFIHWLNKNVLSTGSNGPAAGGAYTGLLSWRSVLLEKLLFVAQLTAFPFPNRTLLLFQETSILRPLISETLSPYPRLRGCPWFV